MAILDSQSKRSKPIGARAYSLSGSGHRFTFLALLLLAVGCLSTLRTASARPAPSPDAEPTISPVSASVPSPSPEPCADTTDVLDRKHIRILIKHAFNEVVADGGIADCSNISKTSMRLLDRNFTGPMDKRCPVVVECHTLVDAVPSYFYKAVLSTSWGGCDDHQTCQPVYASRLFLAKIRRHEKTRYAFHMHRFETSYTCQDRMQ